MTLTTSNHLSASKTLSVGFDTSKRDAIYGPASVAQPNRSELARWYEDALSYYNAVVSGEETPPNQAAYQEFLNQMSWCAQQLDIGNNWDPTGGGDVFAGAESDAAYPAGAIAGTMGNVAWNQENSDITFNGDSRPQDIWSNAVTINVPSLSATVQADRTTDTRWDPPEDVLRITVSDPATGGSSVYFVHDHQDATITVNTVNASQFPAAANQSAGKIIQGIYDPEVAGQVAVSGTPYDDAEGDTRIWNRSDHVDYVATAGEETDVIYADTVSLSLSDRSQKAYVKKVGDHDYIIEVRDAGGDVIRTIETHQTNGIQFSGVDEENLYYWDASNETAPTSNTTTPTGRIVSGRVIGSLAGSPALDHVIDHLSDSHYENFASNPDPDSQITLAGFGGTTGTGTIGPVAGDSPTREDDATRTWDGASFDIATRADGKTNNVLARGEVYFHASSNQEYWTVEWKDGQYVVTVHKDSFDGEVTETFNVDPMASKLHFDVASNHLQFLGDLGDADDRSQINDSDPNAEKIELDFTGAGGIEPAETNDTGDQALNPGHSDDSKPRIVSEDGTVATYDTERDVSIHTYFGEGDDIVRQHNITASGKVTLYPGTQADQVKIEGAPDGNITISFTGTDSKGNPQTITYTVDAEQADKILIKADPANVDISGLTAAEKAKLRIGAASSETIVPIQPSSSSIKSHLPSDRASNDQTVKAAEKMGAAFQSGDWSGFADYIESLGANEVNDVIRNLIHSLDQIAGSSEVFKGMLRQIPADVRQLLMRRVQENHGELDQDGGQGNARWNSRQTASQIQATLSGSDD